MASVKKKKKRERAFVIEVLAYLNHYYVSTIMFLYSYARPGAHRHYMFHPGNSTRESRLRLT